MMIKQRKTVFSFVILGLIFFSGVFSVNGAIFLDSKDNIKDETDTNLPTDTHDHDHDDHGINSRVEPIDFTGEDVLKPTDFTGEEVVEPLNSDDNSIEWLPMEEPLRNFQEGAEVIENPTATISYDVRTGVETISTLEFTPEPESPQDNIRSVEPYAGLLSEMNLNPESVVNNPSGDQRTIVSGQTAYPWRTIVKLYIADPWGGNWVCSGAMIDNYHVLTAGHCAYIRDNPNFGWATSIKVVPAFDTADTPSDPYGHAWMTLMRSYTGWTVSGDSNHDWAVLTLDRNIGAFTGWMGRITAGSGNSIYTQTMNVAGYPTDVASGNRLAFDSNSGNGATSNSHRYWADTGSGESGAPVWRYVSGSRYIMTVHAYGAAGGNPANPNSGTRLNSDKYDRIFTWLGADSAPTDKADLVDRGSAYSGYNTGTVTQGVTSFNIWNDVRNMATASSGGFYVYYYASTNTIISSADHFIGSDYVSSMSPFTTRDSSWTGIFPASIPAGNYYVGWIIDAPGWVNEFDETNNKAYITSQITVVAAPPPPGYIQLQVNDALTSDPIDFAYITVWDALGALVRTAYTNSTGFFNITAMDTGTYNVTVLRLGYRIQEQLLTITSGRDDYYLTYGLVPYPPDSGFIEVRVNESRTLEPIENAYLSIYNTTSGELFSTGYTDNSGFFNITGLYIGWWTVKVFYPGFNEEETFDYINWNGDDDYLQIYMDINFQRINGSVALFRDNLPWNVNSTEPILAKYNISYTLYNSSDFGSVNLSQYKKVIIASEQVQTFYDRLEGNVTWFEDYAANGGVLELHAVDRKGNYHNGTWNTYLYPGGINKTYNIEFVNNSINMPMHPFILKPFLLNESQVDGWIGGHFTVYPSHAREILLGPTFDPILIEFTYGSGFIVASTQTLEWNANYGGTQQLFENLVLYDPLAYQYLINVTAPVNSNSWEVNQSYQITWDSTDNFAEVKIDLYRGGTFVEVIISNTTNDGDFLWSVPDLIDSTLYQIKVMDASYILTFDYSEMFEIFNPSINVTNPIGTSVWAPGASEFINWTSRGTIANVKIELFIGGILELEISPTTVNDGLFLWELPSNLTSSDEYSIKISDASNSVTYDFSLDFQIVSPSGIPGYGMLILSGSLIGVILIIIKKKRKKLSIHMR